MSFTWNWMFLHHHGFWPGGDYCNHRSSNFVLQLCCTTAFPPIFLQLRKGPLWNCANFQLFWGMLGRGVGGWRGISAAGRGYNEVLALEVQNVVWLRQTKEKCKSFVVCNWSLHVRCRAVVPSVFACISYVHFVCVCPYMCMCVCVYVCGHVYMYVYACVYVFVHLCIYTHVYVYVYTYLCIDCGSWYQCFSVWTVSCMRMCFRVHMYAYTYVCGYIYMRICLQWVLHALYKCFGH